MASLKYVTTFAVSGSSSFPTDMLRRDRCFPDNPDDADKINEMGFRRTVKLVTFHSTKNHNITFGRWDSFSWSVVPNSIMTRRL
ncbi:MAG: hypothetical protein CMB80_31070 [Flammeovirgaceae bacterium]|nr:hypothetical protein [Flammeovirgaceae bacterium]